MMITKFGFSNAALETPPNTHKAKNAVWKNSFKLIS